MTAHERARYRLIAELVRAVSSPARLQIMEAVSARPRCVGELAALTGRGESTISKHVAILRQVGLLESTKSGLRVICGCAGREAAWVWRVADCCAGEMRRAAHGVRNSAPSTSRHADHRRKRGHKSTR